ncbi:4-hydroxybenzoate polyprenyl transferase, partial [Viridothelium virens]
RSSVSQSVPPAPTEPTYQAPSNGVLALLPEKAVPYAELMRLEKPTGLYLFYFPYLFGITFAACNVEPTVAPVTVFSTSLLLFVGTIIMRGAACTWNDTHDRNFDRQVARTRFRPIARGAVTPLQAHAFTLAQAAVGIATLASMPANVSLYAAPNVALLGFYPFAKRITNYPQVILGFPVAWGIFMGSAALGFDPIVTWIAEGNLHGIGAAFGCLYASNLVWTIIYDTIYAHQDVEDDKKAGVKSIAVKHKTNTKPLLSALSVVQMSTLVAAGVLSGMGPVYYVVSCGGASASLAAMVWNVELGSPKSCMWWFKNGALLVGGTITLGLFGEY